MAPIGLPRIARTPEIQVQLIASNDPPGGVSGLGVAVLAPAVANAIFAATGKRMRSLPLDIGGSMMRPSDHPAVTPPRIGVLLINLGTPDAPDAGVGPALSRANF